jgi:hypothetical protein
MIVPLTEALRLIASQSVVEGDASLTHKEAFEFMRQTAKSALDKAHAAAPILIVLKTNCAPVVHEAFANVPGAKVLFVDEDVEGCETEQVCVVEGDESWVGMYPADYTPARVDTVVRQIEAQGVTP